jgi:hypothetical protein
MIGLKILPNYQSAPSVRLALNWHSLVAAAVGDMEVNCLTQNGALFAVPRCWDLVATPTLISFTPEWYSRRRGS